MKRLLCSTAAALLWIAGAPGVARADDALKQVQQSLRDQGFYYGSIDGAPGDETTQAIRRYQIRNGLQVSGQLNDETKKALLHGGAVSGTGASAAVPPSLSATPRPHSTPTATSQPTPRQSVPPVPRVAPTPAEEEAGDAGGFHRGDASPATPPAYRPPVRPAPDADDGGPAGAARPGVRPGDPGEPPDAARAVPPSGVAPSARLTAEFAGTPYEFAPPPVQASVIRRAQNRLLRQGFYDQEPDGRPNALTAEALTNFQGFNRLRRTGRLDTATLAALRLLPGTGRGGGLPNGDYEENGPRRGPGPGANGVYEGRIVQ